MKDLSGDEIGWVHIVCAILFSSLLMSTCEEASADTTDSFKTTSSILVCLAKAKGYAVIADELNKSIQSTKKFYELKDVSLFDLQDKLYGSYMAAATKQNRMTEKYLAAPYDSLEKKQDARPALAGCKNLVRHSRRLIAIRIKILEAEWIRIKYHKETEHM
ncbi:MAG: hypothetical protein OYH77_01940 [Pseudomonadota bacterium]|nr:hypothetical protein [Pseudomonadota bacterium]